MFFKPQDHRLKDLIVCYWLIRSDGIPPDTKMLPDGYSDIMLNLGAPYTVSRPGSAPEQIEGSVIFGQRTGYLLLNQPQKVNMIGIRLQPGKEFAFTGIQAEDLVNTSKSMSDFLPSIKETENDLRIDTLTDADRIMKVEEMMLQLLARVNINDNIKVDEAIQLILQLKGNISIEQLTSKTALTYKQAERYFKKHLGLSPKIYVRIQRFYYAFTQVRALDNADWMLVLHNCGYYDQAHFIKDFCFFAGIPPGKQLSEKDTLDHFFGFS